MAKNISSLPVGALVKDPNTRYNGQAIIFKVVDKNHSGYPANSVTLMTDKIISLKCFDAREPSNSDKDRQNHGNSRYIHSNIRKWLNSKGVNWYSNQHSKDHRPDKANVWENKNEYDNEAGFLTNFSSEMINAILNTSLQATRANVDGSGKDSLTDKIFLASCTEMGLSGDQTCGTHINYFNSNDRRKAKPTAQCVSNSEYTNSSLNANSYWYYWLRDAYASHSYLARYVNSDGTLYYSRAYRGYDGVRPFCNLKSSILVSDSAGSDGAYTIIWNRPPTISESDSNLGVKTGAFAKQYTISDVDAGQVITVTEKINDQTKRTYTATSGSRYQFNVTASEWLELLNGQHELKIIATDSSGGKTIRKFSFSKNETIIEFTLKTPLASNEMISKALINITAQIPVGAKLEVFACNNANDLLPTWEDVTRAVKTRRKIFFTNTKKTASKWGFNIKVKINRNNTKGECYIAAISGNFE